jgi:hypothetical protein
MENPKEEFKYENTRKTSKRNTEIMVGTPVWKTYHTEGKRTIGES